GIIKLKGGIEMYVCIHTIEIVNDESNVDALLFTKTNQIDTSCGEHYSWMGPRLKYCMYCGKKIIYNTVKYEYTEG
ncbi:MAG: hypothetical protein ACLU2L_04420, partial [Fenollaria timonensis]